MIQLIEDNTLMVNDELLVQLSYADYAYLADVRYRATAAAYTVHVDSNDLGDTKSESYWEFINNYIKNQQTIKAETIAQTFEDDWTSYIDSIKACNEMHDIRY